MPICKWRCSYETYKYDTPDGELHKGQYAFTGTVYLIRNHPENNNQPILIDPREDLDWQTKIAGLTEVSIIPDEHNYYDEFILPNSRIYRVPSTKNKHDKLKDKDQKIAGKNLSNAEIADIKKDDDKWL